MGGGKWAICGETSAAQHGRERASHLDPHALAGTPLPWLWDVNGGGKHYLQMSFHRAQILIRQPRLQSRQETLKTQQNNFTSITTSHIFL